MIFAKQRLSPSEWRHEHIHTLQQRELLFVGFFVWYIVEWLVRLLQYRNAKRKGGSHRVRLPGGRDPVLTERAAMRDLILVCEDAFGVEILD